VILGLNGKPLAGKDTIADFLVRTRGFVKIGFSDAIIAYVKAHYGATLVAYVEEHFSRGLRDALGADALIDRILQPGAERTAWSRALLQDVGTRKRREDPAYWTRAVEERIDALIAAGRSVAVTGVRYPDEVAAITRRGGLMVHVHRPGHRDAGDGHVVENGLNGWAAWDHVFTNGGTVAELETQVTQWLHAQKGEHQTTVAIEVPGERSTR